MATYASSVQIKNTFLHAVAVQELELRGKRSASSPPMVKDRSPEFTSIWWSDSQVDGLPQFEEPETGSEFDSESKRISIRNGSKESSFSTCPSKTSPAADAWTLPEQNVADKATSRNYLAEEIPTCGVANCQSKSTKEQLESAVTFEKCIAKQCKEACDKDKLVLKQQEVLAAAIKAQLEDIAKLDDQQRKAKDKVCELKTRAAEEQRAKVGPPEMGCDGNILTLMMRNLPCRCTSQEVLDALDSLGFGNRYDFFYLPIMGAKQNKGYAFISFPTLSCVEEFTAAMQGFSFEHRQSAKTLEIVPARIQGLSNCLAHFEDSRTLHSRCSPFFVRTREQTIECM